MCNDISHTSIEAYVYNEEVHIKLFSFRFKKRLSSGWLQPLLSTYAIVHTSIWYDNKTLR